MSETVYLAGKLNSGEATIASFGDELEERGHVILEKWYEKGVLPTPYLDNLHSSAPAAAAMIRAAYNADVFVLFAQNTIFGAAVELGVALASTAENPNKKLYLLKPSEAVRQSVFYSDTHIEVIDSLDTIRQADWF